MLVVFPYFWRIPIFSLLKIYDTIKFILPAHAAHYFSTDDIQHLYRSNGIESVTLMDFKMYLCCNARIIIKISTQCYKLMNDCMKSFLVGLNQKLNKYQIILIIHINFKKIVATIKYR